MRFVAGLVLGFALAVARPALAEDVALYEVEGDADAGGSDPRVAALDEAFGKAVAQALGELVTADVRKQQKAVLDKEIVARARLWVTRFAVIKDETNDGRRQLTVTVRVDRDKMRDKLGQLQIATGSGEPDAGQARSGVILMRIVDPTGLRASYGTSAERDVPGMGALASSLRGAGIAVKRAPTSGKAKAEGDLPLDDDEADAMIADGKAEVGVIVGVTVGASVPVRGIDTTAMPISVHVRVIGKGKKLLGQGNAQVASRGGDGSAVAAAIERGIVAAAGDALPAAQTIDKPNQFTGDDTPVAEPGVVLIKVPVKTPYALIAAELKYLAGAKGISRAGLHRVSPGGWVIGVSTTESVQKIAGIARKAPTSDTSVQVKVVGDVVELAIAGGR